MIKIGICEDDITQQKYLKQEITSYYKQKKQEILVETFESAEELLFCYPIDLPFFCLILDIKMKEMNGMTLAMEIRKRDKEIQIIFITGDKDFVFDGYKVGAVRYILKPYHSNELIEALEHIELPEKNKVQEAYFCLNYMGDFLKLKKSDIFYVEVKGHYIFIQTKDGEYNYKESMKKIKEELVDKRFVMANRSILVNVQNIEKIIKSECILCDGKKIKVSRGCYKSLSEAFIDFYKE